MARPSTPGMLRRILEAATLAFIRGGYRNTRVDTVAERAGVSVGTVYRYAESKEALFELVLRHAFNDAGVAGVELPYRARAGGSEVELVLDHLDAAADFSALFGAIEVEDPADVAAEFEALVRELYGWQHRYWRALKLIERCARDWPELSMLFYEGYRETLFGAWARYVRMRIDAGLLRPMPDAVVAARFVTETCAFFAMHRHTAPRSDMPDALAEETVVRALCNAFVPDGETTDAVVGPIRGEEGR